MRDAIDQALDDNDELTSRQLQSFIKDKWPDVIVSCSTIGVRGRKSDGCAQSRTIPNESRYAKKSYEL